MKIHIKGIGVAVMLLALTVWIAAIICATVTIAKITGASLEEIKRSIGPKIATNTTVSIVLLNIIKLDK